MNTTDLHAQLTALEDERDAALAEAQHQATRANTTAQRCDELYAALRQAQAEAAALRSAVENVDRVLTREGVDEWVIAYVMPAGPWHKLLGLARNASPTYTAGAVLLSELAAARAVVEAARYALSALNNEAKAQEAYRAHPHSRSLGENTVSAMAAAAGKCAALQNALAAYDALVKEERNG